MNKEIEDTALFGGLNAAVADQMAVCVDKALSMGVSSLPLLKKGGQLHSLLRRQYFENIDILEVYCERNIFTTCMFAADRRQTIAKYFLNGGEIDDAVSEQLTIDDCTNGENHSPSPKDIPTSTDMKDIKEELSQLRAKLHRQKLARVQKTSRVEALRVTKKVASQAKDLIPSEILPSIEETLTGTQGLVELQSQGRSVARKMDSLESELHDKKQDSENIINLNSKRQKTMKERFEDEFSQLKGVSKVKTLF